MIELWEEKPETGNISTDAFNDFNSWRSWLDERCPGLLDQLNSMEDEASLYGLMCGMSGAVRRQGDRDLLCRAFIGGVARWEPWEGRKKGEVCTGGICYSCDVDDDGTPILTSHVRAVLKKQLGETGG